jgi:adhesin/invasin
VNPVVVTIGGMDAAVSFAGLTPGFAGLYQVNAVVPQGVASGNSVPLALSVGGQVSQNVAITLQ